MAPTFAASLPKLDMRAKHDRCAIVGHSGSMLGTGLGNHIDTYAAVFRMDNAPSAYKYAQDVGRRTTYQVRGTLGEVGQQIGSKGERTPIRAGPGVCSQGG